ncbi:MAG TPA: EpsD family peptidyl-prolyl cis-trans isomerase [Lautropia sp.]|nr:EpsD family peptidyl-prolyl cis-trans isomerase [Lautropia sp.]
MDTQRFRRVAIIAACLLSAAACGDKVKSGGQVAAKVNSAEITVHQVNYVLQRTSGLTAESVPQVKKEVVGRLVEQELLVQQAVAHKLDRDPRTLAALEAARREVLSRAYMDRAAQAAGKPEPQAVKRYYEENPLLFQQRKTYGFNEIVLASRPANWRSMEPALAKAPSLGEVAKVLKAGGIPTPTTINVVRSAEQLPIALVDRFARTKVGEVIIYPAGNAIVAAEIRSIEEAPLSLPDATPLIENFLLNRDRTAAARSELERLRAAAQVAYKGEFADLAQAEPSMTTNPVGDAPAVIGAAPPAEARDAMTRGIRGLK